MQVCKVEDCPRVACCHSDKLGGYHFCKPCYNRAFQRIRRASKLPPLGKSLDDGLAVGRHNKGVPRPGARYTRVPVIPPRTNGHISPSREKMGLTPDVVDVLRA